MMLGATEVLLTLVMSARVELGEGAFVFTPEDFVKNQPVFRVGGAADPCYTGQMEDLAPCEIPAAQAKRREMWNVDTNTFDGTVQVSLNPGRLIPGQQYWVKMGIDALRDTDIDGTGANSVSVWETRLTVAHDTAVCSYPSMNALVTASVTLKVTFADPFRLNREIGIVKLEGIGDDGQTSVLIEKVENAQAVIAISEPETKGSMI